MLMPLAKAQMMQSRRYEAPPRTPPLPNDAPPEIPPLRDDVTAVAAAAAVAPAGVTAPAGPTPPVRGQSTNMSKFAGLGVPVDDVSRLTLLDPYTGQAIRNPETKETAWIDLLPATSRIGKAHDRQMLDKNIKRGVRRMTAEELEADEIEKLAKLTKGWSLLLPDGTPLPVEFSTDNARELYSEPAAIWIVDQVRQWVADLGNFRRDASTS